MELTSSSEVNQTLFFHVWRDGRSEEEVLIQEGMTLGSADSNTLRVSGENVLPLHARVLRRDDGILELVCENPTFTLWDYGTGRVSARLTLANGVRVMLGNTRLICQMHSSSHKTDPPALCMPESLEISLEKKQATGGVRHPIALLFFLALLLSGSWALYYYGTDPTGDEAYRQGLHFVENGNLTSAVTSYRKAAENGNVNAKYQLAVHYAIGKGVEKNGEIALQWCLQAAEKGHAKAQVEIGILYLKGISFEQDQAKAVEWFRKSAVQGEAEGQYYLALCYSAGHGVLQNTPLAEKWFRKAASQGHQGAKEELTKLDLSDAPTPSP